MANELITREDIVRGKRNFDAFDKYLDGSATEQVKLPSGKTIKTRAGFEKEIEDKFPDTKAGLRTVGNNIKNIPEVTSNGVGRTGLGFSSALPIPEGSTSIATLDSNSLFSITPGDHSNAQDLPRDSVYSRAFLLNMVYANGIRANQIYFDANSPGLCMRVLSQLDEESGDYIPASDWVEFYHSGNKKPYQTTTATQPNLVVEATGELRRSTSSRVFKDNIQPLEVEDYREALRMFEPVSYNSKHTADNPEWVWYSFIAEDLAEVDTSLVQLSPIEFYEDTDEDGNTFVNNRQLPEGEYAPVGLNFNGIITMLTRINQHMLDDIEDLEKEKTQLKTRMTKLENRLAELEKLLPAN